MGSLSPLRLSPLWLGSLRLCSLWLGSLNLCSLRLFSLWLSDRTASKLSCVGIDLEIQV